MSAHILPILVSPSQRSSVAKSHFGSRYIHVESFAFDVAASLSPDYDGGLWDFFLLSNGGFYMAPPAEHRYRVQCGNGFDGEMTADAFGITVCLYAYSMLSFSPDAKFQAVCTKHYHWLRDYMLVRPEATQILGATD